MGAKAILATFHGSWRGTREWSTQPVGGKPFLWQPASGRLAVVPIGQEQQNQRFALTLDDGSP